MNRQSSQFSAARKYPGLPMLLLLCLCRSAFSQDGVLGEPQERIIHYSDTNGLTDPVALLQNRLDRGQAHLKFDEQKGYLPSLLQALRIRVSSQALVFSKTSSQREDTSPRTPRAIYFADDVSLAWTPDAPTIDIISVDPNRGPIFYTINQIEAAPPRFTRSSDCMGCHLGSRTFHVPGLFVRSVFTASNGVALGKVDEFVSGHNSPLRERWGGWYVSGTHANEEHLGNIFATNMTEPERLDPAAGANLTDLRTRFDSSRYLSAHSDIVALLVLEHQVRMQNLLTRANYETRYALKQLKSDPEHSEWPRQRIANAGEALLEYMLFRDEAPLKGRVRGTSGFSAEFERLGPFDSKGRSLRQFDLQTRLFRYPSSFLIYSQAFDSLPAEMKTFLWRRLREILTGQDQTGVYAQMSEEDRRNVLEILRETKPEFRAALRQQEDAVTTPLTENSHQH